MPKKAQPKRQRSQHHQSGSAENATALVHSAHPFPSLRYRKWLWELAVRAGKCGGMSDNLSAKIANFVCSDVFAPQVMASFSGCDVSPGHIYEFWNQGVLLTEEFCMDSAVCVEIRVETDPRTAGRTKLPSDPSHWYANLGIGIVSTQNTAPVLSEVLEQGRKGKASSDKAPLAIWVDTGSLVIPAINPPTTDLPPWGYGDDEARAKPYQFATGECGNHDIVGLAFDGECGGMLSLFRNGTCVHQTHADLNRRWCQKAEKSSQGYWKDQGHLRFFVACTYYVGAFSLRPPHMSLISRQCGLLDSSGQGATAKVGLTAKWPSQSIAHHSLVKEYFEVRWPCDVVGMKTEKGCNVLDVRVASQAFANEVLSEKQHVVATVKGAVTITVSGPAASKNNK